MCGFATFIKIKFYVFTKYLLIFVYIITYICEVCAVVAILHFQKVFAFVSLSFFIKKIYIIERSRFTDGMCSRALNHENKCLNNVYKTVTPLLASRALVVIIARLITQKAANGWALLLN